MRSATRWNPSTGNPPSLAPNPGASTQSFVSTAVVLAIGVVSIAVTPSGHGSIINGAICLSLFGIAGVATARIHGSLGEGLASGLLMPWYSCVFVVTYGLSTLSWLTTPTGDQTLISIDAVRSAVQVVAVGFAATVLAYMAATAITPTVRFGNLITGRRAAPTFAGAWILFGIWVITAALSIRQGNVGYVSNVAANLANPSQYAQLISLASNFGLLSVAIAAAAQRKHKTIGWSVSLGLFVVSLAAYGLLSGVKENLVYLGLAVVLGRAVVVRKLPAAKVVVVFTVLLAIVVPVITAYREVINLSPGRMSISQVLSNLGSVVSNTQEHKANQHGVFEDFLWRESRISDVAIIVQRTPTEIPYKPATDVAAAPFIGMVPRAIWPNKPILDTGLQFSREYYHLPNSVYSSSAITPIGDLYRHGGYATVIIGMALLGLLMALLDSTGQAIKDERWIFLVLMLFPTFLKQEIDYSSMASALPYTLVILAIGMRLSVFGAKRLQPEPAV